MTGGGDGTLTAFSGGSGEPRLAISCGSAECVYGAGSIGFDLEGGNPAALIASRALSKKSGDTFFCPASVSFDGNYEVDEPQPAYVAYEGVTTLCETEPEEGVCPPEFTRGLDLGAELASEYLRIDPFENGCAAARSGSKPKNPKKKKKRGSCSAPCSNSRLPGVSSARWK